MLIRHTACIARPSVIASSQSDSFDVKRAIHVKEVLQPHRAVSDRIEEAMNKSHDVDSAHQRSVRLSQRPGESASPSHPAPSRHRPRVEGRTEFKDFDYGDPIDLTQFEADVHPHHPSFSLLGW